MLIFVDTPFWLVVDFFLIHKTLFNYCIGSQDLHIYAGSLFVPEERDRDLEREREMELGRINPWD